MTMLQHILRNVRHVQRNLTQKSTLLPLISKSNYFSTLSEVIERESMSFDVLIIGGGPSGLSASIRLKQLCAKHDIDLSVCVLEKGSEVGSHILSGNVFETRSLKELLGEEYDAWVEKMRNDYNSIPTPVTNDQFMFLSESSSYTIPNVLLPSQLHNEGNYIISLSQLCRYLGNVAEELGVEIFPGFAASDVIMEQDSSNNMCIKGVITKDAGIGKDGNPKSTFEPGMKLLARQTLFAEGARGSCTQSIIKKLKLDSNSNKQTYALGLKEVWTIPDHKFKSGLVQHTLGWPLQSSIFDKTFGGSFLYHQEPNLLLCGLVIGLDYTNPYLNPYKEFQRWKTHPDIKNYFEEGTCISYGARVLNEGGYHSIPKLTFKGGMLIGCSAGFLNTIKIKGTHTAIKSGIEAAETVFEQYQDKKYDSTVADLDGELSLDEESIECTNYQTRMDTNWVGQELYQIRNCHAAFAKWGLLPGLIYSGIMPYLNGKEPWTLSHITSDSEQTSPSNKHKEILYPTHDGKITFDLLTNLQRSNTYHEEDQPSHLKIKPDLNHVPKEISMQIYAAPETRFCPAGVYEYPDGKNLVMNAQNCIHCKCCSIKMPHEYIEWSVPEGGGGPQYQVM